MLSAPTDDQIRAFLKRHGLPSDLPIERSSHEGVVNYVRLTGGLCIRILKETDYASDVWTETVAVPAVRAAGAAVPELLLFDPGEKDIPALVTVYRRLSGEPFGQVGHVTNPLEVYREIGRQAGLWHRGVREVKDPEGRLDKPELPNLHQTIARNAERMSDRELRFTHVLAERLEEAKPGVGFVHWDLHTHNVMVHEGRFEAMIDWGDAGWGDPAINFHCLPAEYLPEILEAFGELDVQLVGRCLYGALAFAVNDIYRPEDGTQPYRNGGHRRWRSLIRLLKREDLGDEWRYWLDQAQNPLT